MAEDVDEGVDLGLAGRDGDVGLGGAGVEEGALRQARSTRLVSRVPIVLRRMTVVLTQPCREAVGRDDGLRATIGME